MSIKTDIQVGVDKINEKHRAICGVDVAVQYEWKPIPGFEGLYEINEKGIVIGLVRGKVLKTPLDKYGYKKLVLSKDGKKKFTSVHRQVAKAFIPNPENLPEVNHKDGDKLNNYWENLEWTTGRKNMQHAHETGLIDYNKVSGENCYITNLTNSTVKEIRQKMANGVRNKDIEKEYGLGRSTVSKIRMNQSFKSI
tara:strand:- start:171 stop:755 length:585 start_codon:yes stop_codon:yes gene_type:complete